MTGALARSELRLFVREPANLLAGVVLPSALLAGLGTVPALREPSAAFGGRAFLTVFAPSLLAVSVAVLGLQVLPVGLASYREKGVLRRLAVTPVSPVAVLVAQIAITLAAATAGTLLLVGVAVLGVGLPVPRHPLGLAAAYAVGTGAVFAVGLVVAAVAPRARAASAVGTVLLVLSQFFAGVYLPTFLLPDVVVRVGAYVPPGVTAFSAAWLGAGPPAGPLLAMAALAVAGTALAVRVFRWQ